MDTTQHGAAHKHTRVLLCFCIQCEPSIITSVAEIPIENVHKVQDDDPLIVKGKEIVCHFRTVVSPGRKRQV